MTSTSKICPVCGNAYAADDLFCPKDRSPLQSSSPSDDLIGSIIGERYVISSRIGAGGMGEVYKAQDVRLQRTAAVKVLRAQLAGDFEALARFNREAANAAKLNNPHVVQVYDYGETDGGRPFLAMEFVSGLSLRAILERESRLNPSRAAGLISQIACGLEAAHRFDIVHRDLKPDNVLVCLGPEEDEVAKVVDFGISKALCDQAQQVTRDGYVTGTCEFMSPEQVRGRPLDGRSDVYSLGLVAYLMLAGTLPFSGETAEQSMILRLTQPHRSLRDAAPSIVWSDAVQSVFDRVLAGDPADRYPSAKAFAAALTAALAQDEPAPATRSGRWKAAAAVAAGLASIGLLAALFSERDGGDLALPAGDSVPIAPSAIEASPVDRSAIDTSAVNTSTIDPSARAADRTEPIVVPAPDTTTPVTRVAPTSPKGRPATPLGSRRSGAEAARRALAQFPRILHPDMPADSAMPVLDSLSRLLALLPARRDSIDADLLRAEAHGKLEQYGRACEILGGARKGATERQREKIRFWVDRGLCSFPDWAES